MAFLINRLGVGVASCALGLPPGLLERTLVPTPFLNLAHIDAPAGDRTDPPAAPPSFGPGDLPAALALA